ncbi:MAG: hypothetical protein M3Q81_00180 [bacterium]|nr:hypothetical protein [bacterium]
MVAIERLFSRVNRMDETQYSQELPISEWQPGLEHFWQTLLRQRVAHLTQLHPLPNWELSINKVLPGRVALFPQESTGHLQLQRVTNLTALLHFSDHAVTPSYNPLSATNSLQPLMIYPSTYPLWEAEKIGLAITEESLAYVAEHDTVVPTSDLMVPQLYIDPKASRKKETVPLQFLLQMRVEQQVDKRV